MKKRTARDDSTNEVALNAVRPVGKEKKQNGG